MPFSYSQHAVIALNKKKGLPPGSPIYTGRIKKDDVSIERFQYHVSDYNEKKIDYNTTLEEGINEKHITWMNVVGLNNPTVFKKIASAFQIHSLVIEDILNIYHRPKAEQNEQHLFVTLKMIQYDKVNDKIDLEQVSFLLGTNYLLSFQEKDGDVFDTVRERIRNAKGEVRNKKADYLLFLLIDIVLDNYYSVIEHIGNKLDDLEEGVLDNPSKDFLLEVQELKKQLITLRKSVFPLREAINHIEKGDSTFIKKPTLKYFRDTYDTTISLMDSIETYREMLSSLKDIYLSSLSNKMNAVMKVLTIMSTIFIPLTFIAGVYGMNFKNMPELENPYGYHISLISMVVIAVGLIIYFKKKDWL